METSLHRTLKSHYGSDLGGRDEVTFGPFRADAVSADGEWIEIQSGPLGPLRPKLGRILPSTRVRIVKPVVVEKRIIQRKRRDGRDLSARLSPKRGAVLDVFDDLIGIARVFPHPNLAIDVLGVAIDEVRVPSRRRPGFRVVDRILRDVRCAHTLRFPADLFALLAYAPADPFTTLDLAAHTDRSVWFAQRIAYCLRHSGAAAATSKIGNRIVYLRADIKAENHPQMSQIGAEPRSKGRSRINKPTSVESGV